MPEITNPSRRTFLHGAALAGVGAGATAFGVGSAQAAPVPPPATWDNIADVIIVGGGAGGLVAASILAQNKVSVILLEKEPTTGGSSAICGGQIALAGTDMQKAQGINDSKELLIKDILEVGGHVNDVSLVQAYADNQLDLYAWLQKTGAKFLNISAGGGESVPRGHVVNPGDHLKLLRQTALAAGVRIMDMTPAQRLVYDEGAKRVVGVIGQDRSHRPVSFKANKAVILATGGYARDKTMLGLFTPPMRNAAVICGLGSSGDGLRMGWANGAGLADVAYVKATFGFKPGAVSITNDFAYVYYKGAILVNQQGKRFVNESISYKLLGDAASEQAGGYAYQIYDEPIRQSALQDSLGAGNPSGLEKQPNAILKADSIAALAGLIGISPQVLEQTVAEYNANAATGTDPLFGRVALSGNFGKPAAIQTGPFYAFKSVGVILGTYAGITITPKAQVTDVYGDIIPGLYAIGEVIGGFHGGAYMTGTAFGKTQVFGLIAAQAIMNTV